MLEGEGSRVEGGEVVRPAWHVQAACRGVGPNLFFPDQRGPGQSERPYQFARQRYCAVCPVRAEYAEAGRHEAAGRGGEQTRCFGLALGAPCAGALRHWPALARLGGLNPDEIGTERQDALAL